MSEKILGVAISHRGTLYSNPPPARHGDLIKSMGDMAGGIAALEGEQGFVTTTGRFVDRAEAYQIASAAGQMIRRTSYGPDHLYSEDLW